MSFYGLKKLKPVIRSVVCNSRAGEKLALESKTVEPDPAQGIVTKEDLFRLLDDQASLEIWDLEFEQLTGEPVPSDFKLYTEFDTLSDLSTFVCKGSRQGERTNVLQYLFSEDTPVPPKLRWERWD